MRRTCLVAVLLLSLSPGAAQQFCDSSECQSRRIEQQRQELETLLCELHDDNVERQACLMRLTPLSVGCSSRPTPQEQIKCLEGVVEGLMRMLPAIIANQVKKELTPRLHE